jgi:sugar lactone lactonase YvrE
MRTLTTHQVTTPDSELAEGPVWLAAEQALVWVDIPAGRLHRADLDGGLLRRRPTLSVGGTLGAAVPIAGSGDWLAAAGHGFLRLRADGTTELLAQPEAGHADIRMNDGKCDPQGRFWAGSMSGARDGAGSLHRLDHDGTAHRVLTGVGISNGLGWSPDSRAMYYVDSNRATLDVFDYDPDSGTPTNRRTLVAFEGPATPDGLTVDDSGAVWLALWDGGRVERITPDGRLDTTLEVPVGRPTSCVFGGPDGGTLYITTARNPGSALPGEHLAGSVLACTPGTTGPATTAYTPTRPS